MSAVYNEHDPHAARWLGRLIEAGHIAPGKVIDDGIESIEASDVAGATQAHFFAGIGVWSYALRLAGWPDDAPVWTGSCPCQPFSVAGHKGGARSLIQPQPADAPNDDRHLWPVWRDLIAECRPAVVFGEQVASPDGRYWLAVVQAQMEDLGYAVGGADLCAAGVGAPHIRQRLFWVAHLHSERCEPRWTGQADGAGSQQPPRRGHARGVGDAHGEGVRRDARAGAREEAPRARKGGAAGRLGDVPVAPGATGFWSDCEWLPCRDGKLRPVEPGSFPLAHGAPERLGRLRGYGNAIVAPLAALFIRAAADAIRGGA